MDTEDLITAFQEVLDLLDDTEVPTPIPIETEEDQDWWTRYIYWRWVKGPYI